MSYINTSCPMTLSTSGSCTLDSYANSKIIIPPFAKAVLNSNSRFINKDAYLEKLLAEKQYKVLKEKRKIQFEDNDSIYNKTEIDNKTKEEDNKEKDEIKELVKETKDILEEERKNMKENKLTHIKKKKSFFSFLKDSLIYMSDNDITLEQIMNGEALQMEPYKEPYSEEFIQLVKMGDAKQVAKELETNKRYLFVHDLLGLTAYHWAAKLGRPEVLKVLLFFGKHGNQKDKDGRTPLHWGAKLNNYDICNILLENKANCLVFDKDGKSPLDLATESRVKMLIRDRTPKISLLNYYRESVTHMLKKSKEGKEKKEDWKKILKEESS